MFELAQQVVDWQAADRRVVLARLVDSVGFSSRDPAAAVAYTSGEPLAGSLFSGAADGQLVGLLEAAGPDATVVGITVSADEAAAGGLACGGTARLLVQQATDLSSDAWHKLAGGAACCLVTAGQSSHLFSPTEINSAGLDPQVSRLFARGTSRTSVIDTEQGEVIVTALWPVPALLIVGDGLIADALATLAGLLGWQATVADGVQEPARLAASSAAGDGVVVLSHDLAVAGPALAAALSSTASYVGALGSRRTQRSRSDWLTAQGVGAAELERIHGPAGLDLGALTPYEIALAITAEMLAVRTGSSGVSLRQRGGVIHPQSVQAPPPRYQAY
jgi:xanthine dehydrogenase accessory factor